MRGKPMTFDRSTLHAQVVRARDRIGRGQRGLMEENTKMALIAPMIQALGWDISDPDEVHCEFHHRPRDQPVDYALMIDRAPCLLIEAKAAGHDIGDRRWATQILTYALQSGVQWALLTNGVEYRIYNTTAEVAMEDKLFRQVSVETSPVEEVVDALSFLSKPELSRRRIDRAWEIHYTDRLVREGLTALLDPVRPSGRLVALLVRGSKGRLTPRAVQASLRRARVTVDIPPEPTADAVGRPDRTRRAAAAVPAEGSPKRANAGAARPRATLAQLIQAGAISPPCQVTANCRGQEVVATIERDGTVAYAGAQYDSLSSAASAARAAADPGRWKSKGGPATNGWTFWRIRDPATGRVVTLDEFARDPHAPG